MAEAKLQAMESDLLDKQVTDSFAGENQRWQRAKTYRRNDGKARKDGIKNVNCVHASKDISAVAAVVQ